MFSRETTDSFFEKAIRIEELIPLALSCHDYAALPDAFADRFYAGFLEGTDPAEPWMQDLLAQIPGLATYMAGEAFETAAEAGDVAEWLYDHNFDGFLACVATPVRAYREGFCSLSWGYYRTTWVYGETVDQIAERAITWADGQIAGWKAKGEAA